MDCVTSDWGDWGPCLDSDGQEIDCGEGTKTRYREIITQAENGGVVCGELTDSQPCDLDPCWDPLGPICVTNSQVEEFNGTYIWDSFSEITDRNTWKKFDSENGHKYLKWSACGTGFCRWEISYYDYVRGTVLTQGAKTGTGAAKTGQDNWPWEASWPYENFSQMPLTPNTSCFDPLGPICITGVTKSRTGDIWVETIHSETRASLKFSIEKYNGTYVYDRGPDANEHRWSHSNPPDGVKWIYLSHHTGKSSRRHPGSNDYWALGISWTGNTTARDLVTTATNLNGQPEWPWEANRSASRIRIASNTRCKQET